MTSGRVHAVILVYDVDRGRSYCANVAGQWLRWPAEEGGWAQRVTCRGPGDDAIELPPFNAALALMLSGVEDEP
jgi:hypothetical protein